jgi:hypothetical protein
MMKMGRAAKATVVREIGKAILRSGKSDNGPTEAGTVEENNYAYKEGSHHSLLVRYDPRSYVEEVASKHMKYPRSTCPSVI